MPRPPSTQPAGTSTSTSADRRRGLLWMCLLVNLTVVLTLAAPTGAAAREGGNAANAEACRHGGWTELMGEDGTTFADQGECVSFGARGGVIVSLNAAPQAVDDQALTGSNMATWVDVLANDVDPDGEPLRVVAVTPPAHGTAIVDQGGVRYEPAVNFSGGDHFSYTVADPAGRTDTAIVDLTVRAAPMLVRAVSPSTIHNDITIEIAIIVGWPDGAPPLADIHYTVQLLKDSTVMELAPSPLVTASRIHVNVPRLALEGGTWDIKVTVDDGGLATAHVLQDALTVIAQ